MNKFTSLYLYGAIIIAAGFMLAFSEHITFQVLKFTLGIGLIIGAVLAFLSAISREKRQVQFAYHELHGLAMLVYGTSVLLFCNTLEMILNFTAFLLIFYTFSEIIFCNWLFNLRQKVVYKILFIRLFLGLLTGIGTILSMYFTDINTPLATIIYGIMLFIIGINVITYVPIMKRQELERV